MNPSHRSPLSRTPIALLTSLVPGLLLCILVLVGHPSVPAAQTLHYAAPPNAVTVREHNQQSYQAMRHHAAVLDD